MPLHLAQGRSAISLVTPAARLGQPDDMVPEFPEPRDRSQVSAGPAFRLRKWAQPPIGVFPRHQKSPAPVGLFRHYNLEPQSVLTGGMKAKRNRRSFRCGFDFFKTECPNSFSSILDSQRENTFRPAGKPAGTTGTLGNRSLAPFIQVMNKGHGTT